MTAAHLPQPPSSLEVRQRLQDGEVSQLKSKQTVKSLTAEQVMAKLRPSGSDGPTTYERDFLDAFNRRFPEAKEHTDKYQTAPNCGCRRTLRTLIQTRREVVTELLDKVFGSHIYEIADMAPTPAPTRANTVSGRVPVLAGKVAYIEPTPEAYAKYMAAVWKLGIQQYNGLSVVPTTDKDGNPKWAMLFW